jgi:hypothetical protein
MEKEFKEDEKVQIKQFKEARKRPYTGGGTTYLDDVEEDAANTYYPTSNSVKPSNGVIA